MPKLSSLAPRIVTEIEIPDPSPQDPPTENPPSGEEPREGAYRNLLVPLVVVPAVVVMVLVLIFVLFGSLAGEEATPKQNIDRLLHGGVNEREQAAFNLVRQVLESWESDGEPEQHEWSIDESLLGEIRSAWRQTREIESASDVPIPLALTIMMARMGDPEGIAELASMTRLGEDVDPDGHYRSYAGFALGAIGDRLPEADRIVAASALIDLLRSDDPALRDVAVIALQTLPGPDTIPALRGMLTSSSVEIRLNAALSLVRLGDSSCSDVLREMIRPEPYRAEHARNREKWAREVRISESRRKALEALVELGSPPPDEDLERLAREDSDPNFRGLALRILASRKEP